MTQISRYPLPKKLEDQMFTLFRRALAELHTEDDVADFLDDLLSPTEKIMLGKRLAIAMLLEKGYDHRSIHSILKVSTTTVSSVNFWLQTKGKGYRKVIRAIQDSKKWNEFFVELTAIFSETFSKKAWYRRAYGGMTDKEK